MWMGGFIFKKEEEYGKVPDCSRVFSNSRVTVKQCSDINCDHKIKNTNKVLF